jgi:hypothetical protein
LTSAQVDGKWSASRPTRFIPGERALGTHCIGVWVDPRVGLDDTEKGKFLTSAGLELRPLGHPARSQSVYRLSYPGSYMATVSKRKALAFSLKKRTNESLEPAE